MKLKYQNHFRQEEDNFIIQNLLRKGWEIVAEPNIPSFDPLKEKVIFDNDSNTYSVINLTEEELETALRLSKQIELDLTISNGFLVQPEGFALALNDTDRIAFSQLLVLVKEALELGIITNDSPQIISDKDGQKHQVSTLRFRQIMVSYGLYYKTIWDSQT